MPDRNAELLYKHFLEVNQKISKLHGALGIGMG
jgi:hypothetical protein